MPGSGTAKDSSAGVRPRGWPFPQVPAGSPGRAGWLADLFGDAHMDAYLDGPGGMPGSGPVAFGSFTFDENAAGSVLVVPQAVLARRDGRAWLTTIGDARARPLTPLRDPGRISYGDGSLSAPEWEHVVARAVRRIREGELEKVVLARDLIATAERPIDVRLLLDRLAAALSRLLHLLRRRPGRRHPRAACGAPARRSSPWSWPAPRRGAPARPTTWRAAPRCSPRRRTARARLRDRVGTRGARPAVLGAEDARRARAPHAAQRPASGQPRHRAAVRRRVGARRGRGHAPDRRRRRHAHRRRHRRHPRAGGHGPRGLRGPVGWIDARGDGEWGIALRSRIVSGAPGPAVRGRGIMGDRTRAPTRRGAAKFRVMQYALEG